MRRIAFVALALFLAASSVVPAERLKAKVRVARPLKSRITELLETPAARQAFWGIEIRDLKSARIIYSLNADRFFVPASNTKLFTTALALSRLGPDFRFRTRVIHSGKDLVLVGAGDPNLSGRTLPYLVDATDPAPLAAIDQLAGEVVARGIQRIEGDIVGDDSAFVYEPFAPGWGLTDTYDDDGPPISALCVDDNVVKLRISPGVSEGSAVQAVWQLPFELFPIANAAITTGSGHGIHYERLPGGRQLRIWGSLPPGAEPQALTLAVDDPALFAAHALRDALVRKGVVIDGAAIARHQLPGALDMSPLAGDLLAERPSQPLLEAARVIDKVSQNLHAEVLLRDVALKIRGKGTRDGALEEMVRFLGEAGLGPESYHFADGSGLSRYNIVTPHAIATLLQYMAGSPLRDRWIGLMPVGGVDGSLKLRFHALHMNGEIHAKTGSLTHVSALSGYAVRKDGSAIAFSMLVNNYAAPPSVIRELLDKISAAIL